MLGPLLGVGLGLILFCLLWLNLMSLPGNWLMLGVLCLAAWLDPQARLSWGFVALMAGLAALAEVVEFGAQIVGGKRGGASGAGNAGGVIGSMLGAVLGAPFGLILGSLAGALAGAWIGCFAVERMRQPSSERAAQAAWGAFWGRSVGLVAKAAMGAAIIVMSMARFFTNAI